MDEDEKGLVPDMIKATKRMKMKRGWCWQCHQNNSWLAQQKPGRLVCSHYIGSFFDAENIIDPYIRNKDMCYTIPHCQTKQMKNLIKTAGDWNHLDNGTGHVKSADSFKSALAASQHQKAAPPCSPPLCWCHTYEQQQRILQDKTRPLSLSPDRRLARASRVPVCRVPLRQFESATLPPI